MKLAKRFFYRIDIVRNYSRGLLVISFFSLFLCRVLSFAFLFFIGCIAVFSVLSFLKVPKSSDLAEFVSDEHAFFEADIKRHRSRANERDFYSLYAYSPKRRRLARNIGNRMYFPEFYTLVFQKTESGLSLYQRTTYLFENKKAVLAEYAFSDAGALTVECGEADTESEYRHVIFKANERVLIECFVRNDHGWRAFWEFAGKNVRTV